MPPLLHADLAPAVQECLDFLESSEDQPERCDRVYLGADIGFANVFSWSDTEGDCQLDINELAKVCSGQYFQTCLDFLESSEQVL